MEEKWYCPDCGKVFHEVAKRYDFDNTVTDICPFCEGDRIERLEPCPKCGYGWKSKKDRLCEKCQLRLKSAWGRFLRGLIKEEREYLDDLLDGTSVEEFV